MTKRIYIIPLGFNDRSLFRSLFDPLSLSLAHYFGMPAHVKHISLNINQVFDPYRNQYNSSVLLAQLIDDPPADVGRILGVCNFDLFIPILTYVFGEAQLEGIGAIVSIYRLKNEFYGGQPDHHLLMERLLKEATHELGHTYGLYHCHYPGCVMNNSTYVEDIDDKTVMPCRDCLRIIKKGGTKV
ncbi:MAG: archaemetzincin family Zn-dependent metalloprotease [bacterium]|nr:archaemetzincin family Zn-dependent metalloprotease [bacterium]